MNQYAFMFFPLFSRLCFLVTVDSRPSSDFSSSGQVSGWNGAGEPRGQLGAGDPSVSAVAYPIQGEVGKGRQISNIGQSVLKGINADSTPPGTAEDTQSAISLK